jgi:hypothetical protein
MSFEPFGYGDNWWDRLAPHRINLVGSFRARLKWNIAITVIIIVIYVFGI